MDVDPKQQVGISRLLLRLGRGVHHWRALCLALVIAVAATFPFIVAWEHNPAPKHHAHKQAPHQVHKHRVKKSAKHKHRHVHKHHHHSSAPTAVSQPQQSSVAPNTATPSTTPRPVVVIKRPVKVVKQPTKVVVVKPAKPTPPPTSTNSSPTSSVVDSTTQTVCKVTIHIVCP